MDPFIILLYLLNMSKKVLKYRVDMLYLYVGHTTLKYNNKEKTLFYTKLMDAPIQTLYIVKSHDSCSRK